MESWPNGDPFLKGHIDVWLPIGTEVNRTFIVEAVGRAINFMAFSRNICMIKRHRWRGLYPGLSQFILLDNLFGIGPELLHRFRQQVKQVARLWTAPTASFMRASRHAP